MTFSFSSDILAGMQAGFNWASSVGFLYFSLLVFLAILLYLFQQ